MKFFDNQERAKQSIVGPEIRHLQLVRSNVIEHAVDKTLRAMNESHHGIPLKIVPTPELVVVQPEAQTNNVSELDDYRQKAAQTNHVVAASIADQPSSVDSVVSLDAYRQQVAEARAAQPQQVIPTEIATNVAEAA